MRPKSPPEFVLVAADGEDVDGEYRWYGASTAYEWDSAECATEWCDEPREFVMYEATYREVGRRTFVHGRDVEAIEAEIEADA